MGGVIDSSCPKCGATIKYNIKLGKFKCEFCRSEFTIDTLNNNASKTKVIRDESERIEYNVYKCPDCGAQVVCDDTVSSTFCLYCRNSNIIKSRLEGKFAPSKLILFKCEKEQAIEAFLSLKKGRPFAPKYFFSRENVESIQGVYIPFWLYDLKCDGSLEGTGYKIKTWTTGNTHYTKKDVYKIARNGTFYFDKVPVDGANKFDNDIMNSIEPFDYKDLVDYNHAYLSGYLAEMYDVDSENALVDAENRSVNTTKEELEKSIGQYSSRTISSYNVSNNVIKSDYVLLPVYMVSIKFKGKFYIFAMNGQTGKFVGNIPIDKTKQWVITILIFVGVFIATFIVAYLLYLGGK